VWINSNPHLGKEHKEENKVKHPCNSSICLNFSHNIKIIYENLQKIFNEPNLILTKVETQELLLIIDSIPIKDNNEYVREKGSKVCHIRIFSKHSFLIYKYILKCSYHIYKDSHSGYRNNRSCGSKWETVPSIPEGSHVCPKCEAKLKKERIEKLKGRLS
jgi:hypothetical protein